LLKKPLCAYDGKIKELQASDTLYGPIDLSSATEDYLLKPGEIAFIDFSSQLTVFLHITTEEGIYDIDMVTTDQATAKDGFILYANNTSYDTAFLGTLVYTDFVPGTGSANLANWHQQDGGFWISGGTGYFTCRVSTYTKMKSLVGEGFMTKVLNNDTNRRQTNQSDYWDDASTAYTSLGKLVFPSAQSGRIVVKRII
jgi:hypothetical protein